MCVKKPGNKPVKSDNKIAINQSLNSQSQDSLAHYDSADLFNGKNELIIHHTQ